MTAPGNRYKYSKMTALLRSENPRSFHFAIRETASLAAILAPHGGAIEWGTDQIADAVAGNDHRLFCFNGHRLGGENLHYLHVRSHQYDEPQCRELITSCQIVVAIHGCKNPEGREQLVYLGGANAGLRTAIRAELETTFTVPPFSDTPRELKGVDAGNICNLGGNPDGGAQLEISLALRERLVPRSGRRGPDFLLFVSALRRAIQTTLDARQ